jgi:dTMP kinase
MEQSLSASILKNFIVFEGLDGAGTTTQLRLIDELLKKKSIPALTTCEPTNGPVGQLIRRVLKKEEVLGQGTLALLFAADREEHLYGKKDGIAAALEAGRLVISDRYLFSSLAYQSVEVDFEFVKSLNSRFPLPELLIFLETPVDVCATRRKKRGKEELFEEIRFQKRVLEAYRNVLRLFQETDMKIVVLDGTTTPEKINNEIWTIIETMPIVKA